MIGWLRTALFFIGWIAFTGVLGVLALPALCSQRLSWRAAYFWVRLTLCWLRVSVGIRSEWRGMEHRPGLGSIVASQHQSAWDTLMLWCILGNPAFILKRELYWIPIFGWYLWRTGQVAIDRRARHAMQQVLDGARRMQATGRTVVIFPEGTRLAPGETRPFHSGVARLSQALQLPVTPVALNAGNFWPKRTMKKMPGRAIVEFLPAMPPASEPWDSWLAQLQHTIHYHNGRL